MTAFAQPIVALVFGAFIVCVETCQHLGHILHPASWVDLPWHDWVAGAFLVVSGVVARRLYQGAAWGFMSSLLMAAFLGHWEDWTAPPAPDEWISGRAFMTILGTLLVVSLCALGATLSTETVRSSRQ